MKSSGSLSKGRVTSHLLEMGDLWSRETEAERPGGRQTKYKEARGWVAQLRTGRCWVEWPRALPCCIPPTGDALQKKRMKKKSSQIQTTGLPTRLLNREPYQSAPPKHMQSFLQIRAEWPVLRHSTYLSLARHLKATNRNSEKKKVKVKRDSGRTNSKSPQVCNGFSRGVRGIVFSEQDTVRKGLSGIKTSSWRYKRATVKCSRRGGQMELRKYVLKTEQQQQQKIRRWDKGEKRKKIRGSVSEDQHLANRNSRIQKEDYPRDGTSQLPRPPWRFQVERV